MKILIILLNLFFSAFATAQTGSLSGKVINSKIAEPVPFATIVIDPQLQNGMVKQKNKASYADAKGNFRIDSLEPGNYSVRVAAVGYPVKSYSFIVIKDSISILTADLYEFCKYDAHKNDPTCPVCHRRNRVIPILYGLPAGGMDTDKYHYAGCEITLCDPNWYCRRDKIGF